MLFMNFNQLEKKFIIKYFYYNFRSLIINNSLDHGSQLPYVRQARKLGYDVLITNTNDLKRFYDGKDNPIKGVETPTQHTKYVWKNIVIPSNPESVAIVAHSYGGFLTMDLVWIWQKQITFV